METELDIFDSTDSDELIESIPVRCGLTCGEAGTGKSHFWREKVANDPLSGIISATTGIASVNMNCITLNSLLRFFDTDSLRNAFVRGRLVRTLADLAARYRDLIIDEASMLDAEQLDILYEATRAANDYASVKKSRNPEGLGLQLISDFAQLPPVKARWCFEAECFSHFAENTMKLTKNWRQGDGAFLSAINLIRAGYGAEGAESLKTAGVEFVNSNSLDFPGTTILAKNDEVDRFNWMALQRVPGITIEVKSERWLHRDTRAPGEWKLIPQTLKLKKGCFVMILSNNAPHFDFANGDTGIIEDFDGTSFHIRLKRNDKVVQVGRIERTVGVNNDPITLQDDSKFCEKEFNSKGGDERLWNEIHYDKQAEKYVVGSLKFWPIKLAYAITTHRSQSLTLDAVQMDIRNAFFGQTHLCYVGISRCRTAAGLRIVGSPALLARRVKLALEVAPWL